MKLIQETKGPLAHTGSLLNSMDITQKRYPYSNIEMKSRLVKLVQHMIKGVQPYLKYFFKSTYPKEVPENQFHIIGVDVIFDEFCEPWLLEINANPSMSISRSEKGSREVSQLDYYIKSM